MKKIPKLKVSFSHKKKIDSFIKQWECVHFAALPSIEDIEKACQGWKEEGPFKDVIEPFREFAYFWDGMKDYDWYGVRLFGEERSEEDLIFRKVTGIDKLFAKGKIR